MASKSRVHTARSSPIPGFVVVVLAVAALFFGLAIVRAPRRGDDQVQAEVVRLRIMLAAAEDERAALALTLGELVRADQAATAALEALELRTKALEEALQRDGSRSR